MSLRTDHKNVLKNVENELKTVKSVGDRYGKARGMGPMCPLREQAV